MVKDKAAFEKAMNEIARKAAEDEVAKEQALKYVAERVPMLRGGPPNYPDAKRAYNRAWDYQRYRSRTPLPRPRLKPTWMDVHSTDRASVQTQPAHQTTQASVQTQPTSQTTRDSTISGS